MFEFENCDIKIYMPEESTPNTIAQMALPCINKEVGEFSSKICQIFIFTFFDGFYLWKVSVRLLFCANEDPRGLGTNNWWLLRTSEADNWTAVVAGRINLQPNEKIFAFAVLYSLKTPLRQVFCRDSPGIGLIVIKRSDFDWIWLSMMNFHLFQQAHRQSFSRNSGQKSMEIWIPLWALLDVFTNESGP